MDRTGSVRNGVTALGAAALLLVVGAAAAEPPKTIERFIMRVEKDTVTWIGINDAASARRNK
jgi:hypothetical protein